MDLVLDAADEHFFTPYVYPSSVEPSVWWRQILTLHVIVVAGGYVLYLALGAVSFVLLFDKRLMKHQLYIPNQIWLEIKYACSSIPFMGVLTVPIFFAEVRGNSKLYDDPSKTTLGWAGVGLSVVTFILFTDMLIYWIHRVLHHKTIYKYCHKGHHKWKVPTPFASHAFHPVDGWLQSLPYHIYPFLFPLHKVTYLVLFVFVNFWTVSIHDGNYNVPHLLKPFVNGSAHHTDHHLFYNYNYGQFFTLWDRIGGSFRVPSVWVGKGPLEDIARQEGQHQNGVTPKNGVTKQNGVTHAHVD